MYTYIHMYVKLLLWSKCIEAQQPCRMCVNVHMSTYLDTYIDFWGNVKSSVTARLQNHPHIHTYVHTVRHLYICKNKIYVLT